MITRRDASLALLSAAAMAAVPRLTAAGEPGVMELPRPQTDGGKPLMQALMARRSTREFGDRPLSLQIFSNLLWAAWGINRLGTIFHTAPSSHSAMDIDLYLAMANGVWRYEPKPHRIVQHMTDDIRGETTLGQDFVKTAPLNIIYVSDATRMGKASEADRAFNGIADSAVIGQNVYLFCASEGLATVLRASVPGERLAKRLNLTPTQAIYFAQSVGYPKA